MKINCWLALTMLSVSVFSGCATLPADTCVATDNWESIGLIDGAAGRATDYLINHKKACANVGVTVNNQMWEKGRQQGLAQYCSTTNAYNIGRQGYYMNSVCPASITARLDKVNADGRQYYSFNRQLSLEKEQLKKYYNEYEQLIHGHNLNFTKEGDAKSYLIELPSKIEKLTERIDNLEYALQQLQKKYGY
ncbi:DUF2799 domain-containing protein [Psychrobacter lutiphocae]|uniref:DUF2799 domain-containing protein n=1 Tax=Psychrobacter lutiphocae TaxID=540500 RepID=UPI000372E578|nr:DUF2799 domain-containing protein [Psychrobacter lutiphocae]